MKIYDIEKLDPKEIMKWFKEMSLIPHGSYHEEAISKWVAQTMKKAGADVKVYPSGMILAKLPATSGYENAPVVMLQSHIDMVLAKTAQCKKDLVKEPITVYYDTETGLVKAEETSLGADDGLGAATMIAIAYEKTLQHPKLELVFSVNEEDDPGTCIKDMHPDDLQSTYYINLDGDNVDTLTYGGAGCVTVKYTNPVKYMKRPENYESIKIQLEGFAGGHSGIHITKPHINAITFLSETLVNFADQHKTKIGLIDIYGGPINNAIPLVSHAEIQIDKKYSHLIEPFFSEALGLAKAVAQGFEEKVKITVTKGSASNKMIPFDLSRKILLIGDLAPNKVFTEKADHTTMFSSSNLGFIGIKDNLISWDFKVRSFIDEEAYRTGKQIVNLMSLLGFKKYIYQGALSAFINDITNNKAAIIWEKVHDEVTGRKLNKTACPGGLESASFCKVNPAMTQNTIIVNGTVLNEHSTKEAMVLKDIQEFWVIIKKVLQSIKK